MEDGALYGTRLSYAVAYCYERQPASVRDDRDERLWDGSSVDSRRELAIDVAPNEGLFTILPRRNPAFLQLHEYSIPMRKSLEEVGSSAITWLPVALD
jgi:hypothetical protein